MDGLQGLIACSAALMSLAIAGCQIPDKRPSATSGLDCAATDRETACTEQGAIRGTQQGDTVAFKGIPYAKAPVGALRWRPPEPPTPWEGVRDGSRFGEICPQLRADDAVAGDEDCLTLNIWRPRQAAEGRSLPVMVWLTGGGNHSLSGQGTASLGGIEYNGELLAPTGVVFVSFNIRLGVLGFLAHPALDRERPERVSGNYGSLDQIAMLRWLRRNIASFGGDPNRILLFGTSAGGGNICALMTSPFARGLFHEAVMQSSVPTGCEIQTLADAEAGTGKRVAMTVGCESAADVAACLRAKTVTQIVSAVPGTFGVFPRIYGPNVDGYVFPDQPLKVISRREHSAMPVIIGNTTEETKQFVDAVGPVTDIATYGSAIDKVFGSTARDRILATYPLSSFPTPQAAFVQLTTDAQFTCQSLRVARVLSQSQKEPAYRYLFTHGLENDPQLKARGVTHTIEHAFFFPWRGHYQPTNVDLGMQQQMIRYWTRFAQQGNPNGGDAEWAAYTPKNQAYLELGPVPSLKSGPTEAHCDFWETVEGNWPHL
jgi:para-nitrobenzyl esterase